MYIMSFVFLCVGVSVFILGMLLIKYSLQQSFSERIKNLLVKFTKNRFSAVCTGAFVTFCLQSSSASSVLTATFADSGFISLYQAFWIIVGANLGTTFSGIFTAVPFFEALPAVLIFGIILLMLPERLKTVSAGVLLSGFGLLFVGMDIMGSASTELSILPIVKDVLINSSSPLTGVLTGALFTAVIQSSSAVTALLQVLASDGIIGIRQAFYIILGSNIGTCATCAVASVGLRDSAKKVSLMHIVYNFAGAVLFVAIAEIFPLPEAAERIFSGNIKMQIAVLNIFFNLISAAVVLLLPIKKLFMPKKRKKAEILLPV